MPTKKNNKETWYRTQVVAAKTKPLCLLSYRVLTQSTVLVHLLYILDINLRFRCSDCYILLFYIYCYFTYGVRGCTCKMTSFLDSTHVNLPKKPSLALVWSTVIDKIYLLLIFNQEILWQNTKCNSVYMKFWNTQTLWPLL